MICKGHRHYVNMIFAAGALCAAALVGCASTKIPTLSQRPGCKTSVEGFYHCNDPWDKAKPAIIIRQGMHAKIISGKIVAMDDKGVTFDPTGKGQLRDPGPEYFKFDKTEALIGEDGKILHGSVPDEHSRAFALELLLISTDSPQAEMIRLLLKPNKRFGFCVPPGNYRVTQCLFRNDYREIIDRGVNIPGLTISVKENRSNYIGDIYMDCGDTEQQDLIIIPYKIEHRPSSAARDAMFGWAVGGVIGIAVAAYMQTDLPKDCIGAHALYVVDKEDFKTQGSSARFNAIMILESP